MFDKAREHLIKKGYGDRIMVLDASSATVDLAAAAVGVHPEEIAKSMTFMVNDKPVMILAAGDSRISNSRFKQFFHTKAKMLTGDEVHTMIGHDIGGVCPFGINDGVDVYLDESLKRFAQVYPACGDDHSAVRLDLRELEDASGCRQWTDVCQEQDYKTLFDDMHPGFWTHDDIRQIPPDDIYDEMVLYIRGFNHSEILVPFGVTFGFFNGDFDHLRAKVAEVDEDWTEFFKPTGRIYCAFVGGEVVSFCLVDDMGTHPYFGHPLKIAGPGCVGTVPAYRKQGIGLEMVRRVTMILKDEGYDLSYIHYTGVPHWYEKLGYRTVLRWTGTGVLLS